MKSMAAEESSGSLVRSTLMAAGAIYLFLTGQRRTAMVVGLAYAAIDMFARWRLTEPVRRGQRSSAGPAIHRTIRPETPPGQLQTSTATGGETLEVETRPRQNAGSRPETDSDDKKGGGPLGFFKSFMDKHPNVKAFVEKIGKDNIGMLAAFVSWTVLTSIVPIMVGLVAITGLVLQNSGQESSVIDHIRAATQGTFSRAEIQSLVKLSTQHTGILGLIGFVGILWGGSSVGGAMSTAFQAIFETQGRNFIKEKLIDIGMIFVFTALMLVIVAGSAAGEWIAALTKGIAVPGLVEIIGLAISLISAFVLFMAIYLVFPNIDPPYKLGNVWKGAGVSAVLFTILSLIWPIYAHFQNFSKYGQLLSSILLLAAWIYFFAMITMVGGEVVSFAAIEEAHDEGKQVGPPPQDSVPQHEVLRDQPVPR